MMTALLLSEQDARQIVADARDARLNEICGLLAGHNGRVEWVCPVPNSAADARHYYAMEPAAMVEAMFEIERLGFSLIGIYHSHPDSEPIPSQTDIAQSAYPDLIYLIVGLRGSEPRLAAWRLRSYEVEAVELHVGPLPPADEPQELTNLQKSAIVIGAILAFVFMIVVSLSLLPPAPKIP